MKISLFKLKIVTPAAVACRKPCMASDSSNPKEGLLYINSPNGAFPSQGLAILIRQYIPYHMMAINSYNSSSHSHKMYIKVDLPSNVYISHNESITVHSLVNLINQLPRPFIIMGNFNSCCSLCRVMIYSINLEELLSSFWACNSLVALPDYWYWIFHLFIMVRGNKFRML